MMKNILLFFFSASYFVPLVGQSDSAFQQEQEAIQQLIEQTYIKVVYQKAAEPSLLKKAFHPTFRMYVFHDGKTSFRSFEEWLAKLESNKAVGLRRAISWEFQQVDVTGNAAMVKLEIYLDGMTRYTTDYLCLYKLEDGWQVFTKTFAH